MKNIRLADKLIESLGLRVKEFRFLELTSAESIKTVTYKHIRKFIGEYNSLSEHVRRSMIWAMCILYHYPEVKVLVEENIAAT